MIEMCEACNWDESDESETWELGGPWSLPANYGAREKALALANILRGYSTETLLVSKNTRHAAVQSSRSVPGFGGKFRKDPRRFSSPRAVL